MSRLFSLHDPMAQHFQAFTGDWWRDVILFDRIVFCREELRLAMPAVPIFHSVANS